MSELRQRPRERFPAPGYSVHLGGPWYQVASPDSGRTYFAKDNGRGTTEIPATMVPPECLRNAWYRE